MHTIKAITAILFIMLCATDISCRSDDYEYHVPMHVVRSHKNRPELDAKTLVAFALLGLGSGALCGRLEPACNPVLQIMYLYLWGQVEMNCVDRALYELQQQGVTVSPSMVEHLFWVASWMGYFASLADR